jgi:hypothetical protein
MPSVAATIAVCWPSTICSAGRSDLHHDRRLEPVPCETLDRFADQPDRALRKVALIGRVDQQAGRRHPFDERLFAADRRRFQVRKIHRLDRAQLHFSPSGR